MSLPFYCALLLFCLVASVPDTRLEVFRQFLKALNGLAKMDPDPLLPLAPFALPLPLV
jgi:hypothetical protein